MGPTGRPEEVAKFVLPPRGALHVIGDVFVFIKGDTHDLVGLNVLGEAVANGLSFQLLAKSTEKSIPDDQGGPMVSV